MDMGGGNTMNLDTGEIIMDMGGGNRMSLDTGEMDGNGHGEW